MYTVVGATKTDVTASTISSCVVDYGGYNNIHRFATVKPLLTASLNTGTNYQFDIYGISNPATTNILSQVRMIAGTGATRDYYQIYNDAYQLFTVTPAVAKVETALTLPTITPTIIQSLTNINLNINTSPSVTLSQYVSHIRLVYNLNMRNTLATPVLSATNFDAFDIKDSPTGLAYFYSTTTQTTNFALATSNFMTPSSAETFVSTFQSQIITQKVISNTITYGNGVNTFVAIVWNSDRKSVV